MSERLSYLESKLSDQEEQVALIKEAARGHGVPSLQTAASSGGAGGTIVVFLTWARDSSGLPPNADGVKKAYLEQADSAIRQVDGRSRESADKLRSFKTQIDKSFADNQKPKAFYLIKQISPPKGLRRLA